MSSESVIFKEICEKMRQIHGEDFEESTNVSEIIFSGEIFESSMRCPSPVVTFTPARSSSPFSQPYDLSFSSVHQTSYSLALCDYAYGKLTQFFSKLYLK